MKLIVELEDSTTVKAAQALIELLNKSPHVKGVSLIIEAQVRLWRKGMQGEPNALIGERQIKFDDIKELERYYDVEFIRVV